jgi:hypothetical protein
MTVLKSLIADKHNTKVIFKRQFCRQLFYVHWIVPSIDVL